MLLEAMRECRNFFVRTEETGEFVLQDGEIKVSEYYLPDQFVLITGSVLNDGVYRVESVDNGLISFVIRPEDYPAWVAPVGTTGLYHYGDRVTHNNERWISAIDNNSWEPGAVSTSGIWNRVYDSPEFHATVDEEFYGTIYGLVIPRDFIDLVEKITHYQKVHGNPNNLVHEHFGMYLEIKATDKRGAVASWKTTFAIQLNPFRKMYSEVEI